MINSEWLEPKLSVLYFISQDHCIVGRLAALLYLVCVIECAYSKERGEPYEPANGSFWQKYLAI